MATRIPPPGGGLIPTQVVVVGAGPVGLLLAGELRLGGAEVVVVERLLEPTGESRASQLGARTMELFDQRGLLPGLGELVRETGGHFGGVPLDVSGVDSPHAGNWKVPQFRTEAALTEWITGLGVRVLRGVRLCSLSISDHYVEIDVDCARGRSRIRAAYLVGCDGEHSTVRELGGFDFPGTGVTRELFRADVAGIDIPARRFQRLERGLAIAGRRPDGVTRVMFHEFGRPPADRTGPPDFAEVVAGWARITGEDIGHGAPLWTDTFGNANRLVSRYRHGRVLLAGDAAHQQLPAGGQALNLGLHEAANLGWKLAARVRGWAPAGLLSSYDTERHPVAARVLGNVATQAQLLLGGREIEPLRQVFTELLALPPARAAMAAAVTGLDVRYDVGAGSGHPLLGARLPHAELITALGPITTTRALRHGRGLLLHTSADRARHAELAAAAAKWTDRVDLLAAVTRPGGATSTVDGVLVRPDGHVVWIDDDAPALQGALYRWFGDPSATAD
jgi:2-polyprenyl-6-methoxyphenol hydroxylase-like FAD-dependent oxidoreductase